MSALKVQHTLSEIERHMGVLAPYRRPALFNEFLVRGYTAVTLSSVPKEKFHEMLQAKLCLGTLITLYDDFADRPSQNHPQLLEVLYRLNFGKRDPVRILEPKDRHVVDFAVSLFNQMESVLSRQPHYNEYREILNFDLAQFYSANRFSSLVTAKPHFNNRSENRMYAHHNMGMIMAAMMDLMAVEKVVPSELGAMREVFLMGQRMGRIFNVLATRQREIKDGDVTGELAVYKSEYETKNAERKLRQELRVLRESILDLEFQIKTFSVGAYVDGLVKVQRLHEKMEGVI